MARQTLVKIITALIFAVVVLVPLFYLKQGIYPFLFDKVLFFQALVEVLFGLWLVFVIYNPEYRPRWKSDFRRKSDFLILALLVFVAALVLTAFTGVDVWRSFFSTYERAYGVFGILHMAAFAVVLVSFRRELPWRWIFAASIATSLVIGALATLESYYDKNLLLEQPATRAGGTFGNPSFLAGYLIWHMFLALYFVLSRRSVTTLHSESFDPAQAIRGSEEPSGSRRDKLRRGISEVSAPTGFFDLRSQNDKKSASGWKRLFCNISFSRTYLVLVILFEIFVLIFVNQSRGNILGLATGTFVLLVLFAIRPPCHSERERGIPTVPASAGFFGYRLRTTFSSRATYVVVLVLIVAAGSLFWATRTNDFWAKIPGIERFREISFETEGLQPRLIALRASLRGFLERPILGWGPENFNIVFNKYYDPAALRLSYQETRFDKPHNFVAESLVTGGIVLVLAHLVFLGAFVFAAWRFADKLFGQVTLAALAAYFVGNSFIFSTIGSDLPLFVLVGFFAGAARSQESRVKSQELTAESRVPSTPFLIALITALIFAYTVNVNTMRASNNLFHGFFTLAAGKYDDGVARFKKTLSIWSPWRWNFARDFAAAMSDFYFYNPELAKKEDVLEAIGWMEYARDRHPLDAYNHYALVDMYNQVSDIDSEKFLPAAEREAAIALELSPDRQQVYFSLAKTKTLQGDYPKAIELAKYGLSLDDKVPDGHFYYGLLLLAHGETEAGYAELKAAIRLGRKWKNFYEPLTVGNLLADAGRIEDAIELYAISVVMSYGTNQLEPKTKLGLAFYLAGDREKAKSELQWVSERFDFKTSPQFANLKPILDELGVNY